MHILFFGYGSHAKKIKSFCHEYFYLKEQPIYSGIKRTKSKTDIEIFHSYEELSKKKLDIDCVFITANNSNHLDIFKKCLESKIKFIYIEKPALGVENFFKTCPIELKEHIKYIQVGYHMAYSEAFIKLKKIVKNKQFGDLIRFDFFSGHGLAFKKDFDKSWRANENFALLETVSSHLINTSINITDLDKIYNINATARLNEINKRKDTEHLTFQSHDETLFSLTASWGSPLEKSVKAYFSNGIWEYDFQNIIIKYPRDTFDNKGFFISPKKETNYCEFLGIKPRIFYFLEQVKKNKFKKHEFNNSYLTNYLIQEIKQKIS